MFAWIGAGEDKENRKRVSIDLEKSGDTLFKTLPKERLSDFLIGYFGTSDFTTELPSGNINITTMV